MSGSETFPLPARVGLSRQPSPGETAPMASVRRSSWSAGSSCSCPSSGYW